jgi:outer membrane biogenesis lipoprotein LolB
VPRPLDAYGNARDLVADMLALRAKAKSFRIAGTIDYFGAQRVQGKVYLFAMPPKRLRVELVSPLGSTLASLTAVDGRFAMSDEREGRYYDGEAAPCNLARLIRIPLPAEDVIRVLAGGTPVIDGPSEVTWDKAGHYDVLIRGDGGREQRLEIGPDRGSLELLSSRITEGGKTALDLHCERWGSVGGVYVPYEIRIEMPEHDVDLLVRYDADGVEPNADIPSEAWTLTFPEGAKVEHVACDRP